MAGQSVTPVTIGVDVGGTKTVIGLVSETGVVHAQAVSSTRGGFDDVAHVADLLYRFVRTESDPSRWSIRGIGAGFPEYVDASGALTSHDVLAWTKQPSLLLTESVHAALRGVDVAPIIIESDVRAGAYGEALFGAARGFSSCLYISLGTGLSSSLFMNNSVWSGHRGEAIAIGEWPAPGRAANFSLEEYASGAGISRRSEALTGRVATTYDIVAAAHAGDDQCRVVVEQSGTAIGIALASAVQLIDPALVVLGGGLGTSGGILGEAINRSYESRIRRRPDAPKLVRARNGPLSGMLGAAALAWQLDTSSNVLPPFGPRIRLT
jgi:glucokinase